jgi:hypothetical protein
MRPVLLRRVAGSAALLIVLWAVSLPAEPRVPLCLFHWLTGIPCPLCGLTRGLFALAKGHWTQAFHFNALTPLGFAMLFSLFWNGPWRVPLWTGGLAAFAVYGVYRIAVA